VPAPGIGADEQLTVMVTADVSGLQTGMQQAAAAVQTSSTQMTSQFEKSQASGQQAMGQFDKLSLSTIKLAQAEAQQAVAQSNVNSILEKTVVAGRVTENETNQLAEAMRQLALAAKQVAESENEVSIATEEAGLKTAQTREETQEATHAARGFGEVTGIHLPHMLARYVGGLEGIGPLLTSAFSVVAVVMFVEIINQAIDKIKEGAQALAGWDEAAKKAYDDALKANRDFYLQEVKTREEHVKFAEIGLSGMKKLEQGTVDAKQAAKIYADELANSSRHLQDLNKEKDHLQRDWGPLFNPMNWSTLGDQVKEVETQIKATSDVSGELEKHLRAIMEQKGAQIPAETRKTEEDQSRSQRMASLEARKAIDLAEVASREQATKMAYTLGQIGLEQEVAGLEAAENQKYAILQRFSQQKIALLRAEQAATGNFTQPQVTAQLAQQQVETRSHETKITEIRQQGVTERQRLDNAQALADVEAAQSAADAQAEVDIAAAHQQVARHEITYQQEAVILQKAEQSKSDALIAVLNKRFEIENQYPEKNAAKLTSINAQIEAEQRGHQARMLQITSDADQRQLQLDQRLLQEKVRGVQQSAQQELQMAQQMDNARLQRGQETLRQWEQNETAAINRWYIEQKQILDEALAHAALVYGKMSAEYQKMIDAENRLDQERRIKQQQVEDQVYNKVKQTYDRITSEFNSNFISMMKGQMTFSKVLIASWNQIASMIITKILQIGEKWLFEHVVMAAAAKMLGLVIDTGNAQKLATTTITNIAVGASDAAVAGAATLAYYSAFAPEIAPEMAAIQYGIGMTYAGLAAYEQGGVVAEDQLALVHKKEMVLPQNLSTFIQAAAARSDPYTGPDSTTQSPSGGDTYHVHLIDRSGVEELMREHGPVIFKGIKRLARGGAV
jgi:hypothetical protein